MYLSLCQILFSIVISYIYSDSPHHHGDKLILPNLHDDITKPASLWCLLSSKSAQSSPVSLRAEKQNTHTHKNTQKKKSSDQNGHRLKAPVIKQTVKCDLSQKGLKNLIRREQ